MIKVVVVDDSKFMARGMQTILEHMDFQVAGLGHDGLEGLELYKLHNPDVMLLDITMPNMDGIECLQKVRELDPDARVVMLSAIKDEETIQRCLDAGAQSFLQKPIRRTSPADLSRLCETLENAVAEAV